jgi:hypothetical protein
VLIRDPAGYVVVAACPTNELRSLSPPEAIQPKAGPFNN